MSLVEVAVSILMLGIITFPLIYLVRTGSVYSAEAEQEVAALNFASAIIDKPLNEFRCYILRQLNPGLFPY